MGGRTLWLFAPGRVFILSVNVVEVKEFGVLQYYDLSLPTPLSVNCDGKPEENQSRDNKVGFFDEKNQQESKLGIAPLIVL